MVDDPFKTVMMIWAANVNIPWFLAGVGVGVPAGVAAAGASTNGDSRAFALVSSCQRSCYPISATRGRIERARKILDTVKGYLYFTKNISRTSAVSSLVMVVTRCVSPCVAGFRLLLLLSSPVVAVAVAVLFLLVFAPR